MRISDWSSDVCSSDLPQYGDTDGIAAFGFQISQRLPHFGKISSAQKFVALASAGLSRMCDGVSLNNPPFAGVIEDYGQIAGYLECSASTSPNLDPTALLGSGGLLSRFPPRNFSHTVLRQAARRV